VDYHDDDDSKIREKLEDVGGWFVRHHRAIITALVVVGVLMIAMKSCEDSATARAAARQVKQDKVSHCLTLDKEKKCDCLDSLVIEYEASKGWGQAKPITDKAEACRKEVDGDVVTAVKTGGKAVKFIWKLVKD